MNYTIILITSLIILVVLKIVIGANISKVKKIGNNKEIEEIVNKFPDNIKICNDILNDINKKVKIKEDENSKTSYYVVVTDTIIIGKVNSPARIQTTIHECIHSMQNKKTLIFNYIYSNLYNLYFLILLVLFATNKINSQLLHVFIFFMISVLWFVIRSYLEIDAMIRAEYETEKYIDKINILNLVEKNKLMEYYRNLNKIRNTNIHIFIIF